MTITIIYNTIAFIIITLCVIHISSIIKWSNRRSVLINGVLIIMGAICELKILLGSNFDWKPTAIVVGILALTFLYLHICYLRRMKGIEKKNKKMEMELNIKLEEKFVVSVIEDFKAGDYYFAEVESERVYLKVDKEDNLWKLTYKNYITKEELYYCEGEDDKK